MTASSDLPYPPFELSNRVKALSGDDLAGYIEYEMHGRDTREVLLSMLPDDYSLEGRALLDFGCGAGRTIRHFHDDASSARIVGCDIDRESVDWVSRHLCPPLEVIHSGTEPPLPFPDGTFDFIWAISVFTHLTDTSAAWLLELRRLLKPDGYLMASYMGEINSIELTGEEWDENRIGMNVLRHDESWDLGGPMVMMSDWWVDEHWGRAFTIRDRRFSGGQTWALLEKREVPLTPDELIEPGADPREIAALQHNIVQLQAEIEALRAAVAPGVARSFRPRLRRLRRTRD